MIYIYLTPVLIFTVGLLALRFIQSSYLKAQVDWDGKTNEVPQFDFLGSFVTLCGLVVVFSIVLSIALTRWKVNEARATNPSYGLNVEKVNHWKAKAEYYESVTKSVQSYLYDIEYAMERDECVDKAQISKIEDWLDGAEHYTSE